MTPLRCGSSVGASQSSTVIKPSLPAGTSHGFTFQDVFARDTLCAMASRGKFRAKQIHEPGERPHATADPVAFVKVFCRAHTRSWSRSAVSLLTILTSMDHAGDIRTERDECRACVERTGAQGLDRFIVRRGHYWHPGGDACGGCRRGCYVPERPCRASPARTKLCATHVELLQQPRDRCSTARCRCRWATAGLMLLAAVSRN